MSQLHQDLISHLQAEQATRSVAEAQDRARQPWKTQLGSVGVVGALLFKFKALIVLALTKVPFLLGAGKLLATGGTMLISMAIYATAFGVPFAVGFVLLIFVHEMGHVMALRAFGVKASIPIFIPFVGAFIALKEMPRNAYVEAIVGIAGPVSGTLGALACVAGYCLTGSPFWLALAYTGFFLNLFNLIPVLPLDGGRVAAALSRWLWLAGLGVFAAVMITRPSPILLLLIILSLPRLWQAFRQTGSEAAYYQVTPSQRLWIGAAYFGLCAVLVLGMFEAHETIRQLAEATSGG